ncbi:MAG: carboxylating nicotinate-nucleotide diphosphorylase [Thermodesulfovibrionales bacterium]|jgi:nicotinate-nucleotide pyrophosphorylase (carboxylating)
MHIPFDVTNIVRLALEEDIGQCDITTTLFIPEDHISKAVLVAKESFIIAGMPFAREVFDTFDRETDCKVLIGDGSKAKTGDIIAEISGRTRTLLACERVSLNILQRLSGIATFTNDFVTRVKNLDVKILDTRKTTPGLRFMEKYAVRIGGGVNHRFGLYDGILIKDNHIEAAGSITNAVKAAKKAHHLLKIEVEVENLKELREALKAGADIVMLDNMSLEDMQNAARIAKGKALLEASGNVTIDRVRAVAATGVHFISIGALTHSAPAVDISMKLLGASTRGGKKKVKATYLHKAGR